MKRTNVLRPLAETCSNREVAILAVAIEELYQEKGVDAMTDLLIIQVEETLVVDFCFFLVNAHDGIHWAILYFCFGKSESTGRLDCYIRTRTLNANAIRNPMFTPRVV